MQKSKDHNSIVIFLRDRYNVKITMFVEIKKVVVFVLYQWSKYE